MNLRNRAFRFVGGAVALCAVASACSQPAAEPPKPSPSLVSPSLAETQLERQTRLAFDSAKKAYMLNWNESARLSEMGGATTPTPTLGRSSMGEYLGLQMQQLRDLHAKKQHVEQRGVVRWVRGDDYKQHRLGLLACEDYRLALTVDETGKTVKPPANVGTRVYVQHITAELHNKSWRLSKFYSTEVKSCPK